MQATDWQHFLLQAGGRDPVTSMKQANNLPFPRGQAEGGRCQRPRVRSPVLRGTLGGLSQAQELGLDPTHRKTNLLPPPEPALRQQVGGREAHRALLGFVGWKLMLYAPSAAAERRGRQETGGGERKPELESQTKRVTQKQKLRNTKFFLKQKKTALQNDTEPRVRLQAPAPLAMNLSTSQCISGPQDNSKNTTGASDNNAHFIEDILYIVSLKMYLTTCGVGFSILKIKKQMQSLRDLLQV